MKIIALGDTHGRRTWNYIAQENDFDKFIFINYFDSTEGISCRQQLDNFNNILTFKKANREKVILLFGNHDFHYLKSNDDEYIGFQDELMHEISELLQDAIDERLLQMCFQHKQYVFTHAEVTKTWCRMHRLKPGNLEPQLNDLFYNESGAFAFSPAWNHSESGDDVTQSPIWVRPKSLFLDAIDNYIQIVGHTPQHKLSISRTLKINKKSIKRDDIVLIDTLATSREFLVIDEMKINIQKIQPELKIISIFCDFYPALLSIYFFFKEIKLNIMTTTEIQAFMESFFQYRSAQLIFSSENYWVSYFEGRLRTIELFSEERDRTYNYFCVYAPLMRKPDLKKEEFYLECLLINDKLIGTALCVLENTVYLRVIRDIEGLSSSETEQLINFINYYQQLYTSDLLEKYSECWTGAEDIVPPPPPQHLSS